MAQGIGVRRTQYLLDDNLQLADGGTVITTTDEYTEVSGAAVIIDLGGLDQANAAMVHGDLVIDVSAIDAVTGDEVYNLTLEGSTSATFASGIEEIAHIALGVGGATGMSTNSDVDTDTGRYVIPWSNERNGRTYRYVSLWVATTGTTPSITFKAWLVPRIG